jgi:1-acyl-sn-glycerol-3-phosphate acyltransferase
MPVARVLLRIRVRGRPPPLDGGLIVAPNHQSWIDPLMVQYALYPRQLAFLMTEVYFDLPLLRHYFRAVGARPVRESGPSVSGMRAARDALAEGEWICLFPEGTITTTGELGPGQRGVARLAHRTRTAVLPVGIRGAIDVLSRVQPRPRLATVEVRVGAPLRYEEGAGREAEERFMGRLMERIRSLAYGA